MAGYYDTVRIARDGGIPKVLRNPAMLVIFLWGIFIASSCADGSALDIKYFNVANHQAFILKPAATGHATPWVWFAPTFAGTNPNQSNDWLFQKLLDAGIAIAGVDVGESYGSPAGRSIYDEFYAYATGQAGLTSKVCLLGQSRGGLMAYNWAAENAEKVSGIAGIYPVCDLRSYPGLAAAAPAYGMTAQELEASLSENNPIDRLAPLAEAGISIFHIHGDSDTTVALSANSQVVYDRYTAMGGQMQLVVVPGKGHEEVPEFFQSEQLLDFMISHVDTVTTPEPSAGTLLVIACLCLFTILVFAWWKRRWRDGLEDGMNRGKSYCRATHFCLFLGAACFLTLASCGGPKNPFNTAQVSGKITYTDGTPIDAAKVTITLVPQNVAPIDKMHARPAQTTLMPDGSFSDLMTVKRHDGVIVGKHKVVVTAWNKDMTPCPKAVAMKYCSVETPLEVEVTAGGPNRFELTVQKGP